MSGICAGVPPRAERFSALAGIRRFFREKSAAQCESKNYVTLPFYYVLTTLAMCLTIFGRPSSAYHIVVVSLFLTTAPNLLVWRFELGATLALQIVFLAIIAVCLGPLSFYLVAGLSAVSTVYTIYLIRRNLRNEMRAWPDILGCLIFSYLSFNIAFPLEYSYSDMTDVVKNTILTGLFHFDTAYHVAIANMILRQFVPSTGLHLAPYLPYHYLGHILVAVAATLSALKVIDIYFFRAAFLHFPYIIFLWQMVAKKVGKHDGSFLLIPVFIFGLIPGNVYPGFRYDDHPWFYDCDPSFVVGVAMVLSCLLLLLRKPRTRWIFAAMSVAYFAKISAGFAVSVAYAFVNLMDDLPWNKRISNLLIAIGVSLASLWCVLPRATGAILAPQWHLLAYAHDLLAARWSRSAVVLFIGHEYSFSFLFLGLVGILLLTEGRRALAERKSLLLYWAGNVALSAVALNIHSEVNTQQMFLNATQWLLLPVIAALTWDLIWNRNRAARLSAAGAALVLSLPLAMLCRSRLFMYRHYLENHELDMAKDIEYYGDRTGVKLLTQDRQKRFLPYYTALLAAGDQDRRNEYLIEIPESETDFWQHSVYPSSRYWMAFQIPAISGRPAWNGYNYRFMKNTPVAEYPAGTYSYGVYYRADITDYCQDGRYRGVIRIAKDAAGAVRQTIIDCPAVPRRIL